VSENRDAIQNEFRRTASYFADRTKGRFDYLNVVEFAAVRGAEVVCEVGAGTGHFLSLFREVADRLIAVDLTLEMLAESRHHHEGILLVNADGERLPFDSQSIDLVASAQAFHHIHTPVPILKEMGRVARPEGHVLVVDQVAPERHEEAMMMNQLDIVRDPTHAASRPVSAFRIMLRAAGLEIIDERVVETRNRLSKWMWPGEFSDERINAVRDFIERFGDQTGMDFERVDDDWEYTRRRAMFLARRELLQPN
jgi:ubiquinone/menaquinone biosynthesis C-methylase UbiE